MLVQPEPVASPEQVMASIVELTPEAAPVAPDEPSVVPVRELEPAGLPEPVFVPREPTEVPLSPREPRAITSPQLVSPPEPSFAGAWLGLSLMISLAAGGLLAALRRWRNEVGE